MTTDTRTRRPSYAARRVGYVIAAGVNAVLLYLINIRPGWRVVPVLTEDLSLVLPLINLSLAAGLVANLIFLAYDSPWWRSLCDLVTTAISVVVLVRIWQVFPFAFSGSFDWALLARVLLVIAIAGTGVGVVVHAVSLLRSTSDPGTRTDDG